MRHAFSDSYPPPVPSLLKTRRRQVTIMTKSEPLPDIAPYLDLHRDPRGAGDQRPTAIQIIQDQDLFGKLGHLNILVTGGNSGLGLETVKALQTTGARIIIAVAPGVDGEAAAREIQRSNETDPRLSDRQIALKPIESVPIDLGSLANIKSTAADIKARTDNRLNMLICNAGVMTPAFAVTHDGFEPHFGINYLGHFLLFNELADALGSASRNDNPPFASRVVILSSLGHRGADVDVDQVPPSVGHEPESRVQNFYSESKTELLWMANEIERRFAGRGTSIHALSINPGSIATPLTAHIGWDVMRRGTGGHVDEFDRLTKNPEQGAATTVWAAVGRELEGKGGYYLDDVQVARPAVDGTPAFTHGYAPWAYDEEKARRLWDRTREILREKGFDVAS